jgi:hypothetical protein
MFALLFFIADVTLSGTDSKFLPIYELLPALHLTQSVHAKISIGMHRLGWRYRQKISSES